MLRGQFLVEDLQFFRDLGLRLGQAVDLARDQQSLDEPRHGRWRADKPRALSVFEHVSSMSKRWKQVKCITQIMPIDMQKPPEGGRG